MTQLTDIGQRAEGTQTVQSDEELDQLSLSDRPIQKRGYTSHLGLAISACIFGSSFQAGFNTGVVNSPSEAPHLVSPDISSSWLSHLIISVCLVLGLLTSRVPSHLVLRSYFSYNLVYPVLS
ncbi:hypothetical protein ScPMuIL_008612 [Solemya velum]